MSYFDIPKKNYIMNIDKYEEHNIPSLVQLALRKSCILGSSDDFSVSLGKYFPGQTSNQIKERLIDMFDLHCLGRPIFDNNTFRLHPWQSFVRERTKFKDTLRNELYHARLFDMMNLTNQLKLSLIHRNVPDWVSYMYESMI